MIELLHGTPPKTPHLLSIHCFLSISMGAAPRRALAVDCKERAEKTVVCNPCLLSLHIIGANHRRLPNMHVCKANTMSVFPVQRSHSRLTIKAAVPHVRLPFRACTEMPPGSFTTVSQPLYALSPCCACLHVKLPSLPPGPQMQEDVSLLCSLSRAEMAYYGWLTTWPSHYLLRRPFATYHRMTDRARATSSVLAGHRHLHHSRSQGR